MIAFHVPPTGDLAHNPSMCPDWESSGDPLVHRLALSPLCHTSQGASGTFNLYYNDRVLNCAVVLHLHMAFRKS